MLKRGVVKAAPEGEVGAAEVAERIRGCTECAARFAATKTAHAPNPILQVSGSARLCIAGQAPGLRAHGAGIPFADPSGDRLRAWMGIAGEAFYDRNRLAIVPMAFCFPGYGASNHDLPPPSVCARLWRERLFDSLPGIELIVTVGRAALEWHRPELRRKRLAEVVARGIDDGSPPVLALPHPSWRNNAWLKEHRWFETETLPLLRQAVARLV